jgi:hypothetical protein
VYVCYYFTSPSAQLKALAKPEVKAVKITVPVGYGYILTSKQTNASFAV